MMDKSWMQEWDRRLPKYRNGVREFLDFAFAHSALNNRILCPCIKCNNRRRKTRKDVEAYLVINGIDMNYTEWSKHGKELDGLSNDSEDDDQESYKEEMQEVLRDHFGDYDEEFPNGDAAEFYQLLLESEQSIEGVG